MNAPTLGTIRRENGAAGQVAYLTEVTYPGEETRRVAFVGSAFGAPGPVVMVTPVGETPVVDPDRFGGKLDPAWVRAFFAETPEANPGGGTPPRAWVRATYA